MEEGVKGRVYLIVHPALPLAKAGSSSRILPSNYEVIAGYPPAAQPGHDLVHRNISRMRDISVNNPRTWNLRFHVLG